MTSAPDVASLVTGIRAGDRQALARGITLVESERDADLDAAQSLLAAVTPRTGNARRIGITGVPGVGKSTFVDALGQLLTERGDAVAVLAVDPSSALSGGSILGDKTRMERLSRNPKAFIRPSPGGTAGGGIARHTREAMLLCEAAGFDHILVETIGVGQSETSVTDLVDTCLLLMLAGAGDELQGIKRGVMELADVVVIHKADGDNERPAQLAARDYTNALQLLPARHAGWRAPVLTCSSLTGTGVPAVDAEIDAHRAALTEAGLAARRRDQAVAWFDATLRQLVIRQFLQNAEVDAARERVARGESPPTAAVLALLRR